METTMDTQGNKVTNNLRIIGAITLKDFGDGLRNKSIWTTILTVAFLLAFYRYLPILSESGRPSLLAVYDAGSSSLTAALDEDAAINLRAMESFAQLERYLGGESTAVLGLILPTDFDQQAAASAEIELDGVLDHWVSASQTAKIQADAEHQLTEILGKPAHINIAKETVLTRSDGGHGMMVSLGMVVVLSLFGLSITPVLLMEEKQTKTLDSLLVSPATSGQIVVSKALTSLFYCLIAAGLALAFNASLIVHWGTAVLAVICGAIFTIALGLLLGSIFELKQQLSIWSFILYQPLLLPVVADTFVGLIPDNILAALSWIPTVAIAQVFRAAIVADASLAQSAPKLAYVAGCGLVILVVVAWLVRRSDK